MLPLDWGVVAMGTHRKGISPSFRESGEVFWGKTYLNLSLLREEWSRQREQQPGHKRSTEHTGGWEADAQGPWPCTLLKSFSSVLRVRPHDVELGEWPSQRYLLKIFPGQVLSLSEPCFLICRDDSPTLTPRTAQAGCVEQCRGLMRTGGDRRQASLKAIVM